MEVFFLRNAEQQQCCFVVLLLFYDASAINELICYPTSTGKAYTISQHLLFLCLSLSRRVLLVLF